MEYGDLFTGAAYGTYRWAFYGGSAVLSLIATQTISYGFTVQTEWYSG